MSTQNEGVTTAAAPAEGAPTPTTPAEKPDFMAGIVADLAKGNAPEVPDPVPATSAEPPKTEQPASKPEAAKAEPPKQEKQPAAPTEAPPAPATDQSTRHPFDDDDDPKGDIDPKFTKIRQDFEKMREKLRKAREDGNYGRLLAQTAARAKMTPEAVAKLVDMGARINMGDAAAVEEFKALGRAIGAFPAATTPPPAPAAPAAPAQPDETRIKAIADTIYGEDYADDVKSYLISEDVARAKALKAAKRIALSQPPTPPPQSQPRQEQIPQNAAGPLPGVSPLEFEGMQAVSKLDAEYAQKIPDWTTKVRPLVQAEIKARRARDGGISPVYWVADLADAVNTVRAKLAPPEAPRKLVKPDETVAANRRTPTPEPSKWDGDTGLRAQIAGALSGGGKGLDDILENLPSGR